MDANQLTRRSVNHDFDFFIGVWNIDQTVTMVDGTSRHLTAYTQVEAELDGVVLVEHWTGLVLLPWEGMTEPEELKAMSIRSFDPVAEEWNIHWIDNRNRKFIPTATGSFRDGVGEFLLNAGAARITFSDIARDSVRWRFDISANGNWQTLWVMQMTRAAQAA